MNIALISFGSRGDIETVVALGCALQAKGHNAYLISNADAADCARENGLPARLLPLQVKDMLHREGDALLQARSAVKSLRILSGIILRHMKEMAFEVYERAKDADLILVNERYYILAQSVGERSGAPVVQLCFQPKGATRKYPYLYYRPWFFRLLPNRFTHMFVDRMLLKKFLPAINAMRSEHLDLPPLRLPELLRQKQAGLLLQGFSEALFEPPSDWRQEWIVSGSWQLPAQARAQEAPGLSHFLAQPAFTLCVGFGSMLYDAARMRKMLEYLVEKHQIQVVWVQNWNDNAAIEEGLLHPKIFVLREADHRTLFPKVDAVLHHGGSGTIAAAALAGRPQLVSWFMLDQQFWAESMEQKGAGLNLGAFHRLNARQLGKAVAALQLHARQYRERCAALSARMQSENGVEKALAVLEIKGLLAVSDRFEIGHPIKL